MNTHHSLKTPARSAFTLAETLISATIASTALCAVLTLLSAGISDTKYCRSQAAAVLLARRITGEIQGQLTRSQSSTSPASTPTDTIKHVEIFDAALNPLTSGNSDGSAVWANGAPQPATGAYLVSWQMSDVKKPDGSSQDGMAQLQITVETPPNVAQKNRQVFSYATFVNL